MCDVKFKTFKNGRTSLCCIDCNIKNNQHYNKIITLPTIIGIQTRIKHLKNRTKPNIDEINSLNKKLNKYIKIYDETHEIKKKECSCCHKVKNNFKIKKNGSISTTCGECRTIRKNERNINKLKNELYYHTLKGNDDKINLINNELNELKPNIEIKDIKCNRCHKIKKYNDFKLKKNNKYNSTCNDCLFEKYQRLTSCGRK
jgi:hypothetical protein